MVTTEEGSVIVDDGLKLYTKTWKPDGEAVAKLIFIHGHDHHCNSYAEFLHSLAERKIEVFGFDLRGDGQSASTHAQKGAVGSTARIMADIQAVVAANLPSTVPLFMMGHSMGGTATFTYACTGPSDQIAQIRGFMGEGPDFGLPLDAPTRPPKIAFIALHLINFIYPSFRMDARLKPELLTRDEGAQKEYSEDPLSHHLFSVEGILNYFDRVNKLVTHQVKLSKEVRSVWIGHGTKDKCTQYTLSKKWLEEIDLEDKEYKEYEGAWHNLHSDTEGIKEAFTDDVVNWITARLT
ncbi:alpha/beta hydrolase [Xylogone sp. PMI_703]|nr:alpha/beta hydrolase [Xylogone sp. PMI_703]